MKGIITLQLSLQVQVWFTPCKQVCLTLRVVFVVKRVLQKMQTYPELTK